MDIPVKKELFAVTMITIVMIAIPFVFTDWLPMTDLPQHLSQAHYLSRVLSGNQPDMTVNWLAPNTMTTWLLACMLYVLPPLAAAKTAVFGLLLMSVLGVALLARNTGASPVIVPLAATLLFNQSFYWGLLPFISGFAAFAFLVAGWISLASYSWRVVVLWSLFFLLIFFCHIFWFVAAMTALLLLALVSPDRNTRLRTLFVSALPVIVCALIWYPSLRNNWTNSGFDLAPYWLFPLTVRLRLDYAAFASSGLISNFNLLLPLTSIAFILYGTGRAYVNGSRMVSLPLLALATILLVAYLSMPDKYNNTILFAVRWLPYIFILFLLGSLAPVKASMWGMGVNLLAFAILGSYMTLIAVAWNRMENEEFSGLLQALDKLPPKQKVMGLDYIRESKYVNTETPFATGVAYAETFKDGEANLIFAEHASSLVTYKKTPERPYQRHLSYYSQLVNRRDVSFFDYVLVNADAVTHDQLAVSLGITPVTHQGRWRLYEAGRPD